MPCGKCKSTDHTKATCPNMNKVCLGCGKVYSAEYFKIRGWNRYGRKRHGGGCCAQDKNNDCRFMTTEVEPTSGS